MNECPEWLAALIVITVMVMVSWGFGSVKGWW